MSAQSTVNPLLEAGGKESRRLLIEPGFQLRAQISVLVCILLFALFVGTVLFVPQHHSVSQEPDVGVRALLRQQLYDIHLRLWPLLLVAGLFAVYIGLRWSRRVAEPLHRLHLHLKEMAEGEFRPLHFRPGVEFRIFEEDANLLSRKMQMLATRNRDALLAVYGYVNKLRERLAAGDVIPRADLEETATAILSQLEKIPDILPSRR